MGRHPDGDPEGRLRRHSVTGCRAFAAVLRRGSRVAPRRARGERVLGGDTCIAIYEPERLGFPFGPMQNASIAFRVDDVAAARAELEAKGVTFDGDVFESKVCRMTTFHDPDGNELMLHRRFAPYSDGTMP